MQLKIKINLGLYVSSSYLFGADNSHNQIPFLLLLLFEQFQAHSPLSAQQVELKSFSGTELRLGSNLDPAYQDGQELVLAEEEVLGQQRDGDQWNVLDEDHGMERGRIFGQERDSLLNIYNSSIDGEGAGKERRRE